jgi:hypothetical protein
MDEPESNQMLPLLSERFRYPSRAHIGMKRTARSGMWLAAALCTTAVVFLATQLIAQVVSLDPAKMPTIGTLDERFQSYNIEMVEVIGGRFWKPYASSATNNSKAQEPTAC